MHVLVFEERGKPEYSEKNLSEQGREPTTNSTHISDPDRSRTRADSTQRLTTSNFIGPWYHAALLFYRAGSIVLLFVLLLSQQIRKDLVRAAYRPNPGHDGGRRALSPLRHRCSYISICTVGTKHGSLCSIVLVLIESCAK